MSSSVSTSSPSNSPSGKYHPETAGITGVARPAGGPAPPPPQRSNGNSPPPMTRPASGTPSSSAGLKQQHEGYYVERAEGAPTHAREASAPGLTPPPPPPGHAYGGLSVQVQPVPETTLRGPGRGPGNATWAATPQTSTAPAYGESGNRGHASSSSSSARAGAREPGNGHFPSPPQPGPPVVPAVGEDGQTFADNGHPHTRTSSGGSMGGVAGRASRYVDPMAPGAGTSPPQQQAAPHSQAGPARAWMAPQPSPATASAGPSAVAGRTGGGVAPQLWHSPSSANAPATAGTAVSPRPRPRPPPGASDAVPPAEQMVPAIRSAQSSQPPSLPPPQQQQKHAPQSSQPPQQTAGTATSSSGGAQAPHHHQQNPQPQHTGEVSDPNFSRPVKALSANLMSLYKVINARYCNQRRLATPGPKYNRGYDDKEGHYIVLPGEEILNRYTVQEVLGKGSFGTVLRCYDEKRCEAVALKVTRHGSNFRSQAKLELDILLKLNENPNLNHLVVKLLKVFDWQGHLVLVFELLSFNLYQLIKCTRYNGVSLELVRKFAYQLVCALLQLEQQKPQPIIHCDIKPENILLRNQNRSGIRVIDFGSACYADKCVHRYIQSRFYRCPEVILYLGYTTAIDRWSLGCVLVELHTGTPLFDGRTEAAQLARFEATLGPVPADMIAGSCKAHKFYNTLPNGGYQLREAPLPKRSLESVIGVTTGGPRGSRRGTQGHDEASYWEFLDFITQLLRYRPEERISCQDALRHPFLAPLYLSDQQQRHARRQQQQQQQQSGAAPSTGAVESKPSAEASQPPTGAAPS